MCRLCIVLAEEPSRPEGAGRSAAVSVGEVDWISEFDSVQFQHPPTPRFQVASRFTQTENLGLRTAWMAE